MRSALAVVLAILAGSPVLAGQAQPTPPANATVVMLEVAGDVPKPMKLTTEEFARLPREKVRARDHTGKDGDFEGVPMIEVLKAAGLKFGQDLRGPAMAAYLVVEASDGYRAVFALPELDPAFTNRVILLADRRDGKPLAGDEGTLQVVVPGEKRHSRWVRKVVALRIGRAAAPPPQPPANPTTGRDTAAIVRDLAAQSASWMAPPAALETLEYDFVQGSTATRIRVKRGERRPPGAWMGATLHAGFQDVMRSPDRFAIEVKREPGARTLKLDAKPKDEKGYIRVEVGNGVENSWRGYFATRARQTSIVVDTERLVPLEEQTGSTFVRYADWQEIGAGRWVPRRIDVLSGSEHYRMNFAWVGDTVWLLRSSESIDPNAAVTLTRTRDVVANGRRVSVAVTEAEERTRETTQAIVAMLDANRLWLDDGPAGTGWKPPFQTLSYTFHTVREDVRETAAVDRNGEVVVEIAHDGRGKMKDRLGDREIALSGDQYALSRRGARFAWIRGRSERNRGQPFDRALKHYARIGCQLDLPLFRYRELLDSAAIAIRDGTWQGRPCRVATVTISGGGAFLGCGTMFAFTSWSYIHHIRPTREVLYIDADRKVPVHETLTSDWEGKVFEIDFSDYVQVEPGQWAPRSIRIESKDSFTCEYRFQLVAGRHWMLAEVVSWFKPEDRSRGVIEDVRIEGGRERLEDARQQVRATRALFAGEGEPDLRGDVPTIPFELGHPMRIGADEVRVTVPDDRSVVVTASTSDRKAPNMVPLVFLDGKGRPLFAPSLTLAAEGDNRQGSVTIRGSRAWRDVRSVVVPPGDAAAGRVPIRVVPLRWGEPIAVNIPDALEGSRPSSGDKAPRKALTRAFYVRVDRNRDGSARLTLDIVSIDGMHEFFLDLSAALLGASGEVAASGHLSTDIRVVSQPVERRFEIDLGKIREGVMPKTLAIGIAPGDVTSAPMGSFWGSFFRVETPFAIAAMLASPDAGTRRAGLDGLARWETNRAIQSEFLGDRLDERFVGVGPYSRRTLLRPLADSLARIAQEPGPAAIRADAVRFLGYSEGKGAADALRPMIGDSDSRIREAAVIGLTFLGDAEHLDAVRMILAQAPDKSIPSRRGQTVRLEEDPLIALAHQRSDAAIDVLGATLIGDLRGLRLVDSGRPSVRLEGQLQQATEICHLLGRTENPRSVRWLAEADDLIAGRPELAEHFPRHELTEALVRFPDRAKDRIIAQLESGKAAAVWAHTLRQSRDPAFLPAIRTMLRRTDVDDQATYSAVQYLWNLGSPPAIEAMQEVYDRQLMKANPRLWMRLCEGLAANGDGRGLPDAFAILVDLERPAEPPTDAQQRSNWKASRDNRRQEAESVFEWAAKELLARFLDRKTDVASPEEQRIVLRLLWQLPDLPRPFAPVVATWARGRDSQVAEMARRLLDRESTTARGIHLE